MNTILEHRWGKRRPLSLNVVVRGRDGLPLHGRMSDISQYGMFIRFASHAVSPSTMVEIDISHCGCLRGWVVHTVEEGIGVMVRSLDDKGSYCLGQLLSETSVT